MSVLSDTIRKLFSREIDGITGTGGGEIIMDAVAKAVEVAVDTDNHVDGTTNKVYTAAEKTKLAGIGTGMTVYLDAAQSIPSQAWTKVNFDTVRFDNNGDWDVANKRFIAPVTGVYAAELHLAMTFVTNELNMVAHIVLNGDVNNTSLAHAPGHQNNPQCAWPKCFVLIDLAAGDYLEAFCYQYDTVSRDLVIGTVATWACHLMHNGFSVWRIA